MAESVKVAALLAAIGLISYCMYVCTHEHHVGDLLTKKGEMLESTLTARGEIEKVSLAPTGDDWLTNGQTDRQHIITSMHDVEGAKVTKYF